MKLVGGTPSESARLYGIAGALLGAGPIWHYLYVNHYPLRPELLLLVGAAATLGALGAVVARRIGGFVGSVCIGVLLYLFVDQQFDLHEYLRWPVLLALGVALAHLLQQRRAAIISITLGAFYVASLPRTGDAAGTTIRRAASTAAPTPAASPTRPTLLHVILDEQGGVGGLRLEGDTATANFLTNFYATRGFELFPAAYSRFHRTVESIPELLSLGRPSRLAPVDPKRRTARVLLADPYFELLRSRGYSIRVFQNTYMDYCVASASPVVSCETQSGNSIANIGHLPGSVTSRAMLAGRYFLNLKSHLYRRLHPDPEVWRRSSAGGGLLALRHVRDAIAAGPNAGVAYFVHVLLPHRPLELQSDCDVLDDPTRRIGYVQPNPLSDADWASTLALSGSQIRCTHLALGRVLDALDQAVGREGSIVIVHGDHGSRIFQHRPRTVSLAPLDERQLSGRFSTLLAARRPGIAGGVRPDPVPVQDFVWRVAGQDFAGRISTEFEHFVRTSRTDSLLTDSLRLFTTGTMPWTR